MKAIELTIGLCVAVIFVFSLNISSLSAQGGDSSYEFEADPVHVFSTTDMTVVEGVSLDKILEEKSRELDLMIEEALEDPDGVVGGPVIVKAETPPPPDPVYNFTHKDAFKEEVDDVEAAAMQEVIVVKAKVEKPLAEDSKVDDKVQDKLDNMLFVQDDIDVPEAIEEPIDMVEEDIIEETVEEEVIEEIVMEEEVVDTVEEIVEAEEHAVVEYEEPQELIVEEKVEPEVVAVESAADLETDIELVSDEMAKMEEEEEDDYWNTEIKEQTIEKIQKNQRIDQAFKEAKDFKLPEVQKQEEEEEDEGDAIQVMMTPQEVVGSIIKPEMADMKIDLDFDDTNLQDILMTLGATGEINIVLDPVLKNSKLDLHLKQVSIEEALLLIANTYNLGFKRVGASLFVTQKEKLKEENVVSKLFKLKNISVEEAKEMIVDLIDTVSYSNELNSLLVVGDPEDIIEVEGVLAKIDKPQLQVVLEAKIIEINKDALKELGVDFSDQILLSYQESARPADFANVEDSPGSAMEIFSVARNPIQFDTTIKMLENQNKAKVLSNPRITTINDKEAEIFVGDRIPYTVSNVTGGTVTTDVRWVEPGIRLIITPTIIEDDFVVIKVEPEVSFIFSFLGPNDEYPRVKTREATAHVRIKNGQPFVIGGLLSQEDKQNLYKVPFLGDIPWLGNLFSYESHTIQDTELIITIIPQIVQSEE
ncbi:MAG: hypothetical protein KAR05_09215 [Candidatus Omnitrophica bacterium]|nr:hypothetical protein [Candidatus Omnitrophota bacterium]